VPGPGGGAQVPDIPLDRPEIDRVMDEASSAYARGEFEQARTIAGRVLETSPSDVRMLRIMVSVSCVRGDNPTAQTHYTRLPPGDQEQLRLRCAHYGVMLSDKP
jgi:hypothetical protein